MADKNFKVKSGLQVPSLTTAGPVVTDASGNVTSSATLPIAQGGTGQTTANNALNALLPLQTGNNNYFLQTNQVSAQWSKVFNQLIQNVGVSVTPRSNINILGADFSDDVSGDTTTMSFASASYSNGTIGTLLTKVNSGLNADGGTIESSTGISDASIYNIFSDGGTYTYNGGTI